MENQVDAALVYAVKRLWPAIEHVVRRFVSELGERIEDLLAIFFLLALAARLRRLLRLGRFLSAPDVVEHGNFQFVCHHLLAMPEKTCCVPDGSSPASSQKRLIPTSAPPPACGRSAIRVPRCAAA